jgi:hypothetical protein
LPRGVALPWPLRGHKESTRAWDPSSPEPSLCPRCTKSPKRAQERATCVQPTDNAVPGPPRTRRPPGCPAASERSPSARPARRRRRGAPCRRRSRCPRRRHARRGARRLWLPRSRGLRCRWVGGAIRIPRRLFASRLRQCDAISVDLTVKSTRPTGAAGNLHQRLSFILDIMHSQWMHPRATHKLRDSQTFQGCDDADVGPQPRAYTQQCASPPTGNTSRGGRIATAQLSASAAPVLPSGRSTLASIAASCSAAAAAAADAEDDARSPPLPPPPPGTIAASGVPGVYATSPARRRPQSARSEAALTGTAGSWGYAARTRGMWSRADGRSA